MVVGQQCPPIRGLTFIKGEPLPIGVVSPEKRVLVLEFWATWCGPCRQTIPHLTELQHKFKDKHVYFVGISSEADNVAAVERFVKGMGDKMDYHVAIDSSGQAQDLMMKAGVGGIPHAFVVDATNTITFSGHPLQPGFEPALRAAAAAAGERGTPKREPQALPLVTAPLEELMTKPIKELKALLTERGIDTSDCVEKGDLAKKIVATCATTTYYK